MAIQDIPMQPAFRDLPALHNVRSQLKTYCISLCVPKQPKPRASSQIPCPPCTTHSSKTPPPPKKNMYSKDTCPKKTLFCSSATLNLEQLKNQFALRNIQFVCRCCPLKSCWVIGAGRAHRGAPDRWHKPQGWFARHDRRVTGPKQSFHIREINLSCQTKGVSYGLG